MARKDKLAKRLQSKPKDFKWSELVTLLKSLGYEERTGGKSGGSRRRFVHETAAPIILRKPHPKQILKRYQVEQVLDMLEQEELL